ncbi:alginate lyase family protein [Granulicella sp. L60]|uniref:alginate lyase family protein n=1 Tax=Granulicella sp. L60 TaxID=1641866 RepID=UPI00131E0145|nr:alginate lyase family protein [Granulicella sp. L60]
MTSTRRTFCTQAATLLLSPQLLSAQTKPTARPDVAAIDRNRILHAADLYLSQPPVPLTALPCPRSPGTPHDFYSEAEDYWPDPANPTGPYIARTGGPPNPAAFTAHRDALLNFSLYVPALTAAFVLTKDQRYAQQAVAHLRAWFIESSTRMTPSVLYAQTILPAKTGRFEGLIEAVHLAEVVQSVPFLAVSEALSAPDLAALNQWFADYFAWLNSSRLAGLARDNKSHHGTSWLLQAAAIAHLTQEQDDRALTAIRHQYQASAVRAQMLADGTFPHELTMANPYRNSLFNLDMFAAICLLVTTRFESVWDYELQDGPGMRVEIARHYPYILNRGSWPFRADLTHFNDLPIRPPSLLFAARAYDRPEYAELWAKLPPDTTIPELQRTFPIRQPLLWVTRPKP